MDEATPGFDDDGTFVVRATHLSSIPPARARKRRRPLRAAQRAMVFGVLGVICCGFVFGPLALRWGQSSRIAVAGGEDQGDASLAEVAVTLGKAGMAIHLAVILASLPWLLFMLPLVLGG
jgi:hypothetical protein